MSRITIRDIEAMKSNNEKVVMVTAYDYGASRIADSLNIPILLVGDSLGNVILGYPNTVPVKLDDIVYHTRAVVRGSDRAMIVADMPFMTYKLDPSEGLSNAARCIQDGGAQAVKLEGGEEIAPTVKRIVDAGIPVMGHVGLTPQSVNAMGGYRVQGKVKSSALKLIRDAESLEESGAFALVMELIPSVVARIITKRLSIPTIGIGAGPYCDGQVQVWHDLLGLSEEFTPKHARKFASLAEVIREAISRYVREVKDGTFPNEDESFMVDDSLVDELEDSLD